MILLTDELRAQLLANGRRRDPVDRRSGQCKHCIHWDAPPENEQRAYEWFRLGLSRRRVKRPSGTCDRVLLPGRKSTVFSATSAEFGCLNFEAKPLPARPAGGGFVTIWRNGRVAWQGSGGEHPAALPSGHTRSRPAWRRRTAC